jgi:hypothetical protein
LTAVDKIEIQALWEQERFSAKNVMGHIDSSGTTLKVPPDLVRQVLDKVDIEEDPKPRVPNWVKLMCWNRVFFSGCVIQVHEPDGGAEGCIYKFVFGMQNPHLVCFAPLLRNEAPIPTIGEVGHAAFARDVFDHSFKLVNHSFVYSDDGVWSADSTVSVLINAQHSSDNIVSADGDWRCWDDISAWFVSLPVEVEEKDRAAKPDDPAWEHDVFTMNPWMSEWLKFGDGNTDKHSPHSGSTGVGGHGMARRAEPYRDLLDCEAVMDALQAKREELDLVALSLATPDYGIVLRGGKDLFVRTGRHFDVIRAEASSDDAIDFATQHGLNKSFGMDVDTYDEAACRTVCAGWAALLQFFLDQYRANGRTWDDELLAGFAENPEVAALCVGATPALLRRITLMRSAAPKFIDL